jgi:hypothetical protein
MVGGIRVWLAVVALARGPGTGGPATAGHCALAFSRLRWLLSRLKGGKASEGKKVRLLRTTPI